MSEAKNNFEKVIEIDNQYAYAYYALAMVNESYDDFKSAIQNYEKFLELSNDETVNSNIKSRLDILKKKIDGQ